MTHWTVTGSPDVNQKYQIKRNGVHVADLDYTKGPKRNSPQMWRVQYFHYSHPQMNGSQAGIVWWNKDRAKVLQQMKMECDKVIKD